jgi:AcrR family transcriptional regulator
MMGRQLGRPREAAIDEAILRAAWAELNRVGYASLTVTAVAERAGVKKPALYRRWPTKQVLTIDALARYLPELDAVDHGSLAADLEHLIGQLADSWRTLAAYQSLAPLLADLAKDTDALTAFHDKVMTPRTAALLGILSRAVHRGELHPDVPIELVANLLEGPLMHRAIFGSREFDTSFLTQVLGSVLNACQSQLPIALR